MIVAKERILWGGGEGGIIAPAALPERFFFSTPRLEPNCPHLSPQALCCCVWLVPMRHYVGMVNTACLVRATRNLAANVVIAVFLSEELVTTRHPV